MPFPPCPKCKEATVVSEFVGDKWFIICKSDPCARRDNGTMTIGRPLSNGHDLEHDAIEDYTRNRSRL